MHLRFPSLNRPIPAAPAARAHARLYQDHDILRQRRPGSQHFSTLTTRITTFLGAVDEVRPFSAAALARAPATTEKVWTSTRDVPPRECAWAALSAGRRSHGGGARRPDWCGVRRPLVTDWWPKGSSSHAPTRGGCVHPRGPRCRADGIHYTSTWRTWMS